MGVALVLMEEDWVSDSGAEAGHAALNQFVQQTIDAVIPTLGITHPGVTDDDITQLTAGAEGAISKAVENAQSGWDNFVRWLNSDDKTGTRCGRSVTTTLLPKGQSISRSAGRTKVTGRSSAG